MERLDKIIAGTGKYSRREVKELVRQGRVIVDGRLASSPEEKVDADAACLLVDGQSLDCRRYTYLMLHKPAGVVSATEDAREKTVLDLIPPDLRRRGLFPVGRLDKDTEGLLLLTDDGALTNALLHPRHEVEKEYLVWVTGFRPGAEGALARPMTLDGQPLRPAKVCLVRQGAGRALLSVVIHEGKNRQIRRMCEALGYEVKELRRVRIMNIELGNLKPGEYRKVTDQELNELYELIRDSKSEPTPWNNN